LFAYAPAPLPCSATAGNANTVARAILEKLPTTDSRVSYSQDRHLFHVVCAAGIVYLCMADEAFGRRIPFAFLEEAKHRFTAAYGGAATTALAYAYNTEFSRVLHQQMDYFSTNPAADALTRAKGEMAEVKSVMVENIDKVLDRGEKIELLVDKTEGLAGDAFRFKKQTSRLKHAMWVKNMKMTVLLVCVGTLLLYFVIGMICGFSLKYCRSATGNAQTGTGATGATSLGG
jgi:vesicle-associated membrane protein 7